MKVTMSNNSHQPPIRPRYLETPPPPSVNSSGTSPPPVIKRNDVEMLNLPELNCSPDGKSIYEKNPHPLAYNRSISVKNNHTIPEEASHDTSTMSIGSTDGSEDLLLTVNNRRRRSTSFDTSIAPIPKIKLRPRYANAGMRGYYSNNEFRSHIANRMYGHQGDDDSTTTATTTTTATGSGRGKRKMELTHMRAHTFSGFDSLSSNIFDDVDTCTTHDRNNIVDFGSKGVWRSTSTSLALTPQVKQIQSSNNDDTATVGRTGLELNSLQHSLGSASAFLSSNNSAFQPSKNNNSTLMSHSDKSSSSNTSAENLTGFQFIDEGEKEEGLKGEEEEPQMVRTYSLFYNA